MVRLVACARCGSPVRVDRKGCPACGGSRALAASRTLAVGWLGLALAGCGPSVRVEPPYGVPTDQTDTDTGETDTGDTGG